MQERKLQASASIGIAFNEPEVDTAEDLLRNADAAVCYARAVGNGEHTRTAEKRCPRPRAGSASGSGSSAGTWSAMRDTAANFEDSGGR